MDERAVYTEKEEDRKVSWSCPICGGGVRGAGALEWFAGRKKNCRAAMGEEDLKNSPSHCSYWCRWMTS